MEGRTYLPVWVRIICDLDQESMHKISLNRKLAYCHIFNIVKDFETLKWAKKTRQGRNNKIVFTKKGKKIKKLCELLVMEVKNND